MKQKWRKRKIFKDVNITKQNVTRLTSSISREAQKILEKNTDNDEYIIWRKNHKTFLADFYIFLYLNFDCKNDREIYKKKYKKNLKKILTAMFYNQLFFIILEKLTRSISLLSEIGAEKIAFPPLCVLRRSDIGILVQPRY